MSRRFFMTFESKEPDIYVKLFQSYINPMLTYGLPFWFPRFRKDIYKLEKFTNHYTKSVYKKCMLHPESSEDRLKRLSIPTPHVLYAKHGLIYIFKVLRDQTAKPLSFSSLCCAATRGHSYKLLVPRCNTEIRKNLFFIRLLKVWNSLPECIFSSQSLKSFKSSLRSFDLSGCHF